MRAFVVPWLFAAIVGAGCGRLGFELGDGDGDAPGPVSVTVFRSGLPQSALSVLFHDAGGALVTIEPTNAGGRAVATLRPGGTVTAVWVDTDLDTGTSYYRLESIFGVEPGDDLVIGSSVDPWDSVGDVEVALANDVFGAAAFEVRHGCYTAQLASISEISLETHARACSDGSRSAVLALALDANDDVLGYGGAGDIALSDTTASVVIGDWSPLGNLNVTVRNAPATASTLYVGAEMLRNGISFWEDASSTDVIGPELVFGLASMPSFATGTGLYAFAEHDSAVTGVYRRGAMGATEALDLAARLPALTDVTVDLDPSRRPAVHIVAAGDLERADGGVFQLDWSLPADEIRWRGVIPPGMRDVVMPEFPTFLANIQPTLDQIAPPMISLFEADYVADYDAFRAARDPVWLDDEAAILPPTFTMWFTFANRWP